MSSNGQVRRWESLILKTQQFVLSYDPLRIRIERAWRGKWLLLISIVKPTSLRLRHNNNCLLRLRDRFCLPKTRKPSRHGQRQAIRIERINSLNMAVLETKFGPNIQINAYFPLELDLQFHTMEGLACWALPWLA